jgi:hypothetical protein
VQATIITALSSNTLPHLGRRLTAPYNEWVDQKLARAVKKGIMMAKLLAENFERFNGTETYQQRRGALPKVVQGGGLRLVHVSPICKLSKTAPVIGILILILRGSKVLNFKMTNPKKKFG